MQKLDDWRNGRRRLRDRLYSVVLIPGGALLVLWSIVSGVTLYDGFHLRGIAGGVRDVSLPAMRVLASAQKERTLSLLEYTSPGATGERLALQRAATDRALAGMRTAADPTLEGAPDGVRERMSALNGLIGRLPELRAQVDAHRIDRAQIHDYYNDFVESGSALFEAQARLFPDAAVSRGGLQAVEFFRAADRMARAASLATDGLRSDTLSTADHLAFSQLTGAYHLDLLSTAGSAAPPIRAQLEELTGTPHFRHLVELENQIVAAGPWATGGGAGNPPAIDVADWLSTSDLVADNLTSLSAAQAQRTAAAGLQAGDRNLVQVAVGSVLALAVVLLAILVALRVSARLSRRLNGLRDDALLITGGQLPEIVARLRRGDRVDISGEVARLDYGRDEIGQVAEAFNTAQHTAIAAAVRESQAREGVNTVFLGIAGRSQALVHRLLTMIDRLERDETDPDRMQLLFGLDHLATRTRRNAENLIILGGGQSGRRWSRPIELADVLRSAVAETKHYARVRVQKPPELALHGDAVADAVHLLAELLDNATSFSPPESQVGLHSRTVARGVVIEIEDRGLGMPEADRAAANAMLADPPEFDAMALRSDSRLGLFVVARLAARHGIEVELRDSAHGGTQAGVVLPSKLIVEPVEQEVQAEITTRLPRVRSAAGDAPEEPVEQADGPSVLEASSEWAEPEQWPVEDAEDAEPAQPSELAPSSELADRSEVAGPPSPSTPAAEPDQPEFPAAAEVPGPAGRSADRPGVPDGGTAEELSWPEEPAEPDPAAADPDGESATTPTEPPARTGRHAVDAPTDPTAKTAAKSGKTRKAAADSTRKSAAKPKRKRAEKSRTSTQPFDPATDSRENTPTAEPAAQMSSDVTPSADDWPTTHSYRSDSGQAPAGSPAEHDSGAEPGLGTGSELAAWPTEDPAPRVPAESPEETTDESVAWPQHEEPAATDPTTAPPASAADSPVEQAVPAAEPTDQPTDPDPVPLPRRRKQASLAPELARDREREHEEPAESDAADRSPEEARNLMSAIRRGTDRGREAEQDDDAG